MTYLDSVSHQGDAIRNLNHQANNHQFNKSQLTKIPEQVTQPSSHIEPVFNSRHEKKKDPIAPIILIKSRIAK